MSTVVGKSFWIGLINATGLSLPFWLLLYMALRLTF
jgi:hypothetical protein